MARSRRSRRQAGPSRAEVVLGSTPVFAGNGNLVGMRRPNAPRGTVLKTPPRSGKSFAIRTVANDHAEWVLTEIIRGVGSVSDFSMGYDDVGQRRVDMTVKGLDSLPAVSGIYLALLMAERPSGGRCGVATM